MSFNAGSVEVILGGQFNPAGFAAFDGAVKKSAAHAATFERTGSKAGKRLEQGFTALGLSARTFAAGGVGALGLAVVGSAVKFAAFDKQLRTFQAVSGANQKQIQSLSKAAQDLGVKFGVGATQAASGATELAKGGLTVAQILGGGLQAAITLSVAGQMTLADAASTTANAMNLFGLSGSQAQHVADALSVSANATTADVSDFGMALSQAGSAAKTVGLSFNETVTALEALALAGVKNSDAGTSLKTMLLQLANPTKKAKGVMDDLGLSFFTAQGKFKTLGDVSTMLRQKLGGLTAQQRAQVAQTLAGTDGFRALLALYNQGPAKLAGLEKGLNRQGAAARQAEKQQKGLSGAWDKAKAALENIMISLGKGLAPGLSDGLTHLAEVISQQVQNGNLERFGSLLGSLISLGADVAGAFVAVQGALQHIFDGPKAALDVFLGALSTIGDAIVSIIEGFNSLPGPNIDTSGIQNAIDKVNHLRDVVTGRDAENKAKFEAQLTGVPQVTNDLNKIRQLQLAPKVQRILASDQDAKGKIAALRAIGIPAKIARIISNAPSASAGVAAFKALLAGVPASKVTRILHNAPSARAAIGQLDSAVRRLPGQKQVRTTENALRSRANVISLTRAITSVPHSKSSQLTTPGATNAKGQADAVAVAVNSIPGSRKSTITVNHYENWFRTIHNISLNHASGRGRGQAGVAQVGEGGGPEYVISADTGAGFVADRPTYTGLGERDYVVPLESRFRGRALGLFAALGRDLGVPGFAAGRGPNRGGTTSRKVGGFWVPKKIAWGGVDYGTLTQRQDQLHGDLANAKQDVSQARASVRELKGKAGTAKAKRELRAAEKKRDKLAEQVRVIDREVTAARRTYNQTENLKTDIDNASDAMRVADTKGDAKAYRTAKGNRARLLGNLIAVLKRAYGLSSKNTDYGRSLKRLLSQAGVDLADTNAAKITEPATAAPELLTAEEQRQLEALQGAESLAALTADTGDDITAFGAEAAFWERILPRAQASGNGAFIRQAADALKTARDTVTQLTSGPDQTARPPSPEEIAQAAAQQIATANQGVMDARSQFGSNIAITNHFAAPPPEPHVWAESQRFAAQTAFG